MPPWAEDSPELTVVEGLLRVQALAFKKNPTMELGASPSRAPTRPTMGERFIARVTWDEGRWFLKPMDAEFAVDGQPVTTPVPLSAGDVVEFKRLGEPPAAWIVDGVDVALSSPLWQPARCGALTVTQDERGSFHAVLRGGGHSFGVDSVEWLRRLGASALPTALVSLDVHLAPTSPQTDWVPFIVAARREAERLPLKVTLRAPMAFEGVSVLEPAAVELPVVKSYGAGLAVHPGTEPVLLNGASVPLSGWCTLAPGDVVDRLGVQAVTVARSTPRSSPHVVDLQPWALFPNGALPDVALTQEHGVFVLRHGEEVRRWVALADGLHELRAGEVPSPHVTPYFSLVATAREEWRRSLTRFVLLPGPSSFLRGLTRLPAGPLTENLVAVFADELAAQGDCAAPGLNALASGHADAQLWHERLLVPYARRADPMIARRTLLLSGEHCAGFFTNASITTWKDFAAELPLLLKQPMLQRLERLDLVAERAEDDAAIVAACQPFLDRIELCLRGVPIRGT
ncbi:MAG: FHA domain-containing protein [Myxococcales bacterium]|nr:FHA domain-containing protein [Myxococcales bacterium]